MTSNPYGCEPKCVRVPTRYEYSFDGKTWHEIPVTLDAAVLSDDHVARRYGGFFTGAFVGLVAVDLSGYGKEAIFSHFDYMEI